MSFPQIILLGDSLTEHSFAPGGSGSLLQLAYTRKADILNRGLSGYNSEWLLPFFQRVVSSQTQGALLWVVMLGTNDAVLPGYVHHVPVQRLENNLNRLLRTIRGTATTRQDRVLIVTPPPIDPVSLREKGPRGGIDRTVEDNKQYAEAVKKVALSWEAVDERTRLVDFWALLRKDAGYTEEEKGDLAQYLKDGLHLNTKGYKILYDAIMRALEGYWPEISPAKLPLVMPWWGDLAQVHDWNRKHELGIEHDEL